MQQSGGTVAAAGWTAAILNFRPRRKCKRISGGSPKNALAKASAFFNDVCLRQMMLAGPMMFTS